MTAHTQGNLLVPYIAAGADEVLAGRPLSDRSLWALRDARIQVSEEVSAIEGTAAGFDPGHAVRLVGAPGPRSPHFAALAVGQQLDSEDDPAVEDPEERAVMALRALLQDLDGLADGDADAAARLAALLSPIVDQLAAGELQPAA
jgi:hypothetical protein